MNKTTKNEFIEITRKGPVVIDSSLNYVAVKVNSDNIKMTSLLKEQLINEGKYNDTYIAFFTNEDSKPYSMENLPIYGRKGSYETKHFTSTLEASVNIDLKSRGTQLLERYNEHQNKIQN